MGHQIEWTLVPVSGVLLVYADGRYVGEIGHRRFARRSLRWWAATGWEATRSRFATREEALASIQAAVGGRPSEVA